MTDKKTCRCNMFRREGICWHTGYKPTFQERLPLSEPGVMRLVPQQKASAEDARRRFLNSLKGQKGVDPGEWGD